jgi:hypothetical protein
MWVGYPICDLEMDLFNVSSFTQALTGTILAFLNCSIATATASGLAAGNDIFINLRRRIPENKSTDDVQTHDKLVSMRRLSTLRKRLETFTTSEISDVENGGQRARKSR